MATDFCQHYGCPELGTGYRRAPTSCEVFYCRKHAVDNGFKPGQTSPRAARTPRVFDIQTPKLSATAKAVRRRELAIYREVVGHKLASE